MGSIGFVVSKMGKEKWRCLELMQKTGKAQKENIFTISQQGKKSLTQTRKCF